MAIYAVNSRTCTFNGAKPCVAVLRTAEHKNFQLLFIRRQAKKRQHFINSVAVNIDHLHGLNIPSGQRGGIFIAVFNQLINLFRESRILHRQLRQRHQLLHRCADTACQQQRKQQRAAKQSHFAYYFFHAWYPFRF